MKKKSFGRSSCVVRLLHKTCENNDALINKVKAHVTKSNRALVSYKVGLNIASGWIFLLQVLTSTVYVPRLVRKQFLAFVSWFLFSKCHS